MGGKWLTSMPQVLRDAGLVVDEYPGWEVRARSTGGYDDIFAVQVHHTASSASPANDMAYMWNNAADRPIGAIYLARDGRVTVGAAGATNTSGKGGPLGTSKGTIPLDAANRYVISIEAANNGVGEPWPKAQTDAYVVMVRALCDAYGLAILPGDINSHFEWTTRKTDPAGSSPYATGSNKWNMSEFRQDVLDSGPHVPDPPTPPPTPQEGTMLYIAVPTYPGANDNSEWWCIFESGAVRRAVNSDVGYANQAGIPQINQNSKEHDDYLRSIAM